MTEQFADPEAVMKRALELARRGLGSVEPNPPVGAVIVDDQLRLVAEGFHGYFGGPHAEIVAFNAAGGQTAGRTLFVTLEPCCHHGKTEPCSQAVIEAGISRVVVAVQDPAPHVSGGGIAQLRQAGIDVEVGLLEQEARELLRPFFALVVEGRPYILAKWAMTLDGKIAAHTGASRWISGEASRQIVHQIRGRMDAVMVGIGTALADDPLLTPRPAGPRTPTRIVVDSLARLPLPSQLVQTIDQGPVMLAVTDAADELRCEQLADQGVEIVRCPQAEYGVGQQPPRVSLPTLLAELGRRQMTNVLVEGGGALLGSLFDQNLIDECHVFVAPKLVGGATSPTPLAGIGLAAIPQQPQILSPRVEVLGGDVYIHGLCDRGGQNG